MSILTASTDGLPQSRQVEASRSLSGDNKVKKKDKRKEKYRMGSVVYRYTISVAKTHGEH